MASLRREGVTMYEMELSVNELWRHIRQEAKGLVEQEPLLASFLHATIIGHSDLRGALSFLLASKLADEVVSAVALREIIEQAYGAEERLIEAACADIQAVCTRDPAVERYSTVLLYLKGFQALQAYRIAPLDVESGAPLPGALFPEPGKQHLPGGYPSGGPHRLWGDV